MTVPVPESDPELLDQLETLAATLAPLPAVVRYYDDFSEEMRSLLNLAEMDTATIHLDGLTRSIKFTDFQPLEKFIKHIFVDWINRLE